MKLSEIKLNEGQVDIGTLMVVAGIAKAGLVDGTQAVTLAKCLMAIRAGYVGVTTNFAAYYNEFFPSKELLDSLKHLSKEETQQLALVVFNVLKYKDEQLASFVQTKEIEDVLYYATAASSNE